LSGHDDLFKGMSHYVVELTEIRTILRNHDPYTLVVADEVCRGTEITSGSALTVALLESLLERQTSFICSTHLHNLPDTPFLKQIDPKKLRICHLSTTYDEANDTLVYNRKLKDGSGSSMYGIEVAKYLHLDRQFIDRANEIRRYFAHLNEELLSTKKSRYNGNVYVDTCMLCGRAKDLQTHHLKEQHKADEKGFIDHYHKNSEWNLVVLCRECHHNLHQRKLTLEPKQSIGTTLFQLKTE
jgi:DNA mismatch repair protein MutS